MLMKFPAEFVCLPQASLVAICLPHCGALLCYPPPPIPSHPIPPPPHTHTHDQSLYCHVKRESVWMSFVWQPHKAEFMIQNCK